MSRLLKDLDELVTRGIITQETSTRIQQYYDQPKSGVSRMVIAFGIVGALLVGMGIVMILAHNWDEFSNFVKLTFGLLPMLVSQLICGVLIAKKSTSSAWREASSVLLIFSVATAISIVAQVYNISTDSLSGFLLAWMILCIPIPYLLQSRIASLLCWVGITWYALDVGFGFSGTSAPVYYWALAAALLPYYILEVKRAPDSNGVALHNWLIAISTATILGLTNFSADSLIAPTYISLFALFILIGQLPPFINRRVMTNGWLVIGSGSMIVLLLFFTFEWPDLLGQDLSWWFGPQIFIWIGLFAAACFLLFTIGKERGYKNVLSKSYTHIIFMPLFMIGIDNPGLAVLLTNVLILALGVYTIREGALADKLWKMNYGLLILSILIACRFFDTDMSFVLRGLLFVAIGIGFFAMNFYMMRKRKTIAAR